ncbi:MAG: hypothetical protein JSU70_08470 [Phycisphaerales bacterium]|nr:MAG: hypothetical protein JSU70_08470 [Phycisphaerales bacterium]
MGSRRSRTTLAILAMMAFAIGQEVVFGDDAVAPELVESDFTGKIVDVTFRPATVMFAGRITDDLSGVRDVWFDFQSSPGQQWRGSSFTVTQGELDITAETTLEFLQYSEEGLYQDAIIKLQNDIVKKCDGCAESGEPDKNDWIVTFEQQEQVCPLVSRAVELLERLLQ